MNRIKNLPATLVLVTMAALAFGCSRHVFTDQALSTIDIPEGYHEFVRAPSQHVGQSVLLGGFVTDFAVAREGSTLKIKPYTLDSQGRPERVIEDGEEFLARTDRVLTPEDFGRGHMATLIATYRGLATEQNDDKIYRPMQFEIKDIVSWPRPPHYPYGYHYPYRIF
ncbi:MAG: Slp family lipoprotein [Syntrophotaleaceae bacterium]